MHGIASIMIRMNKSLSFRKEHCFLCHKSVQHKNQDPWHCFPLAVAKWKHTASASFWQCGCRLKCGSALCKSSTWNETMQLGGFHLTVQIEHQFPIHPCSCDLDIVYFLSFWQAWFQPVWKAYSNVSCLYLLLQVSSSPCHHVNTFIFILD